MFSLEATKMEQPASCCCGSIHLPTIKLELLGPYDMGLAIGERFSSLIQRRIAEDPHLRKELLPFAASAKGEQLIDELTANNKVRYPRYWDELRGIADGSGVPFLEVLLLNFRKEVSPFLPTEAAQVKAGVAEECSDILVFNPDLAVIAHNEDANVSVQGHAYLVHATLSNGVSFMAYTYAGELPTCAFGFNNFGVAFTLNAVPLAAEEVIAGGIGRNFVSRDLLESRDLVDALKRVQISSLSAGHSYNLMDINMKKILNIETASKGRYSALEIFEVPYFHANMYLRLQVHQVPNETSLHRQKRAADMPKSSLSDILSVLGDNIDEEYPIYMSGPSLCTLCTVILDMNSRTMSLYHGNPKSTAKCLELSLDIQVLVP